MYRHFLVPLDGTDLSVEVVGNAVGLARAIGARITFFHAAPGDAAASRSAPDPARALAGRPVEILAKAEAAARAFGVPCGSKRLVSDQPAAAIVETARQIGCDLVFMALDGRRSGEGPASATLGALLSGEVPVLVSRAGEPGPSAHAIGFIRDGHRSLAAVLHAWMDALAAARGADRPADPALMRAIVRYVEMSPALLRQPEEEAQLFRRLRARTSEVFAELDEIGRQRQRDRERVAGLAAQVETLAGASGEAAVSATRDLDEAVRRYAASVWEQLGREEGVILPAAQRHLTEADWAAVDAGFAKGRDVESGGGVYTEARQLFLRIVNNGL